MSRRYIRFFLVALLMMQLTSCITARRVNYLQKPDRIIPSYADSLVYEDYKLHIGDKLYVKVFSTDTETNNLFNGGNMSGDFMLRGNSSYADLYSYTIQTNGSILFPMIGEVFMQGKTLRDATNDLEKAIEPLFKFSTVELRVIGRNFSVIGGGQTGHYPIVREKINIFQALAMAGDIGQFGDRGRIKIIRETDNGTIVKSFDIRSEDILHSDFYYIEPNDVIYIQTLDEQFFSISNFPTLLSTTISSISFAAFLFQLFYPAAAN